MTQTLTYTYLAALLAMTVMTTLTAVATPASAHKRSAVALFALVSLWCLADLLSNLAATAEQVRLLAHLFAPMWIATPPVMLSLATHYTGGPRWLWRRPARVGMAVAAAGVLYLVLSGTLYSLHLPASANGGAFVSRATQWQLAVVAYEATYVLAGALIMLRASRRQGGHALRSSALFAVAVMAPLALLAIALNSNLLPEAGDAPHTASLLLALTFVVLGVGMLRREYFAPIDTFRAQRDQARDQLRRREQVLGAMPMGVAIASTDLRRVLYCNPPFESLLDLGQEPVELPPALLALLREHDDAALRSGLELVWNGGPGAERTLMVHASQVEVAGQPSRLIALRDLSAQKQVEAELEDKRAQLLHASKMEAIGRLASGIAHDFNNQLTAILGFAIEAARSLGPAHPQHADLVDIRRAAERAGVLTRQLLSFGRKRQVQPEALELNGLLVEASQTFARLLGPDIRLGVETAAEPACVLMDRAQLEQTLMTLIVNARDAMPQGGALCLRVRVEGDTVLLDVEDSGVGMSSEVQARLFEPFFSTKGEQGTGLGLTTARSLIAAAGGDIAVQSAPGAGTTFTLRLARHVPSSRVEPAQAALAAHPAPPSGGQRHLLLVDDEDLVRRSTARLLGREGYRVLQADGGPSALALFDAAQPPIDVVLTDLAMPGMDGSQLVAELRQRRPDLPVVFMSGHELAGQGIISSQQHFVAKPFDREHLLDALQRSLAGALPASPPSQPHLPVGAAARLQGRAGPGGRS